jgi:hypothetical protein
MAWRAGGGTFCSRIAALCSSSAPSSASGTLGAGGRTVRSPRTRHDGIASPPPAAAVTEPPADELAVKMELDFLSPQPAGDGPAAGAAPAARGGCLPPDATPCLADRIAASARASRAAGQPVRAQHAGPPAHRRPQRGAGGIRGRISALITEGGRAVGRAGAQRSHIPAGRPVGRSVALTVDLRLYLVIRDLTLNPV